MKSIFMENDEFKPRVGCSISLVIALESCQPFFSMASIAIQDLALGRQSEAQMFHFLFAFLAG